MPTNRTRRARSWAPDLDRHRRQELAEGPAAHLMAGVGYGELVERGGVNTWTAEDFAAVLEAMRADWRKHGADVLATWIAEDRGAGTRPYAWWAFDAPEPRDPDESESDYLDRHRLWRPGERARWLEASNAG